MALVSHQGERVRLRDGREVLVGRLTPSDAPVLADAFTRLSEESRRLRFLSPKPELSPSELRYLTEVDGHQHEALCAIDPGTGQGVGVAEYEIELAPKGLGAQLEAALRAAAAGHLQVPPRVRELLRGVVPLPLLRR